MNFDNNETLASARARNVRDALMEDIGRGDWTARLLPQEAGASASVMAKESAVLCGQAWFDECVWALDPGAQIRWLHEDGDEIAAGDVLCELTANARALMSAERPALNFLQMLSGVSTRARSYVASIAGASPNPRGCAVLDTRKTLPGLRQAQKYAVRVGGAANHHMALWDGILIKENHISAAGGIAAAMQRARDLHADVDLQIEVEDLQELRDALDAGATSILLDDFTLDDVRRAVDVTAGRAVLEVSGGVDLKRIREIAATGVDRISIGKLTKDICAVDLSMRVRA